MTPLRTLAMKAACAFVSTLASSLAQAKSGSLDLEKIRQHYAGLTHLRADVEQTRSGKHLLKPFVSEIKLDYTPGSITWRYVKPFEQTVKISPQGFDMGDRKLPPGHSERLRSLTAMLEALFRMDLDAMKKDFTVKVEGNTVHATPLPSSPLAFVRGMQFEFAPSLAIVSVVINTETDSAVMKFSNIRLDK